MQTIAIVGANGFIGRRTIEVLRQQPQIQVRPIVRSAFSAAELEQQGFQSCTADATDLAALRAAIDGCDRVVHCAAGSPWFIRKAAKVAYQAAHQAGVKRLVYLSTASVHGQAPAPQTDEQSALSDRQFLAYNNAKVQAERILLQLRDRGTTEVVMIRPGIVTGPKSSWIVGFVNALLAGTAYLGNEGKGICNSVYIDNLVQQIALALTIPGIDRQAFLAGDRETVTWADLYRPFVAALGFSLEQLLTVDCSDYQPNLKEQLREGLRNSRFLGEAAALMMNRLKPVKPAAPPHQPPLNYELAALYRCAHRLPYEKAQRLLGYEPIVSFAEGCDRTIDWLAQKGYPIKR